MRADSGETEVETSGDGAATLISEDTIVATRGYPRHARITNESGVAGFVSFDGGNTKHRLPADVVVNTIYDVGPIKSVLLYRIAGGTDVTDCYAEIWG